jgi:ubiquinone/menaquinone biosynthesis C-methylase UbiE
MISYPPTSVYAAGSAFDAIAEEYDDLFTRSLIGRAQRDAVWNVLRATFTAGSRVLELNCGTGEDALFLSRMGVSVYACDASEQMIAVAKGRAESEAVGAQIRFEVRPTEQIGELRGELFDGVLSNFSGLNCVADLSDTARSLARLTKTGARMVLCLSSRVCCWETLWFLAHADTSRAFRRWKGMATATLGEVAVEVRYPTMRDIMRLLSPAFVLCSCKAIGLTVPPSYVEHLARKRPNLLRKLEAIDSAIAGWPLLRGMGDHMLLVFERTRA